MTKNAGNVNEVIERLERKAQRDVAARRSFNRVKTFIAGFERHSGDGSEIGGTGATVLKYESRPIAFLADRKQIGNEEIRAADDISKAFHAISGGLMFKPLEMERKDKSHNNGEHWSVEAAQKRYREWANHWSARAKRGDKMLEIMVAAVIDERSLRTIERDLNLRNGRAKQAVIAGLRDYAARAEWMEHNKTLKNQWIARAEGIFVLRGAIS